MSKKKRFYILLIILVTLLLVALVYRFYEKQLGTLEKDTIEQPP